MGGMLNEDLVRDLAQKAGIRLDGNDLAPMTDDLNDALEALEPLLRFAGSPAEGVSERRFSSCEREGAR